MQKRRIMFRTYSKHLIGGWLVLFVGSGLALFSWEILGVALDNILILRPKTIVYDLWETPPDPNQFSVYFFNWTNPEEVRDPTSRPRFQEVGPYVYSEQIKKVDVLFNSNNTLTYKMRRTWSFLKDKSRDLNDRIVTINALAATIAHKLKDSNFLFKRMASIGLASLSTSIAVEKTAEELLFKGYEDEIINVFNSLPKFLMESDGPPPSDKFGWFYNMNDSSQINGVFNVGDGNKYKLTEFLNWNHENRTPYATDSCNRVVGSTGEIFYRPVTEDKVVLFSTEACRYVTMEYVEDEEFDGIVCRKFRMGPAFFDNGTKVSENRCFCGDQCIPSGAVDISGCRFGVPLALSAPHFYQADPFYSAQLDGLEPNGNKHEFNVFIEPVTGFPVNILGRLQMNILVQPVEDVTIFSGLREFYFPVMWFEVHGILPKSLRIAIKVLLYVPPVLKAVGVALVLTGLFLLGKVSYLILFKNDSINSVEYKNDKEAITVEDSTQVLLIKDNAVVLKK